MTRCLNCALASLVLAAQIFTHQAMAEPLEEAPEDHYRVLDWHELVPEGWQAPLVPQAHDEAESAVVDPAGVVTELDNQLVSLPGFIRPVVYEGNHVSEFVLVPLLPHHTRQHAHLESNQMVYIALLEPFEVTRPFEPVWVVGTMTLNPVFTDEGPAAYSIRDAVTTEYKY